MVSVCTEYRRTGVADRSDSIPVNMTLAGRDTIAQTMSWVVYRMDKHPEIADRMREEMDTVLGKENKDAIPDYEQILGLKSGTTVYPGQRVFFTLGLVSCAGSVREKVERLIRVSS